MTVNPLNVLIVDDELPLRQELRGFPWEDCGSVLIGEAGNGVEALQMCVECVPDVIVTDITMPVMDGITLIRELRVRYPSIQIILLTCHSDFRYVQEALRLGALEYILKVSMEEEELKQALNKVREAIIKERHSRNHELTERRLLQSALFSKLLHGHDLNPADWQNLELDGEKSYLLVRIILDAPNTAYLAARQQIQQTLNEMERLDSNRRTWLSIQELEYFVLAAVPNPSVPEVQSFGEIGQELADIMRGYAQPGSIVMAYAIVSEPFATMEELVQSLAFTTEWKNALFYESSSETSVLSGRPLPLTGMTDKHAKEINEKLRKAGGSAAGLEDYLLKDFLVWCFTQRIRPMQLKQRILNWQVEWMKEQESAELDSTSVTNLIGAKTLHQMIACLLHAIAAMKSGKMCSRIEIRSAIKWINENMQQPISLPVIAEQVGLSPHYISRLFREETGDSINRYITKLRMEKAVELLKRTNKKVYEIAEEVGIPSYRYFTVTFRNWTGVSPTDYKRNI